MSKMKWQQRALVMSGLLNSEFICKAWEFTERWAPMRIDPEGLIDREGLRVQEEEFLRAISAVVWVDGQLARLTLKSFFEAYLDRVWMINPVLVPAGRQGRHHWALSLLQRAEVPQDQTRVIYHEVIKDLDGWCYLVEPPAEADKEAEKIQEQALKLDPADFDALKAFTARAIQFGHDWEPTMVPRLFQVMVQSNGDPRTMGALSRALRPWQMDEQSPEMSQPLWKDSLLDALEPTFSMRREDEMASLEWE